MKYGWFSAGAAKKFGFATYTAPDGTYIKVTEVGSNEAAPTGKWNDAVYVGPVDRCIKGNDMNFDISAEELLTQIQNDLAEQRACEKQFPETGKCFCYLCPLVNKSN